MTHPNPLTPRYRERRRGEPAPDVCEACHGEVAPGVIVCEDCTDRLADREAERRTERGSW